MTEYILNGESVKIPLAEIKQFEVDNPDAKKVEKKNDTSKNEQDEIEVGNNVDKELDTYTPQTKKAIEEYTPQVTEKEEVIAPITEDPIVPITEDPIVPIIEDPIVPIIETDPFQENRIITEEHLTKDVDIKLPKKYQFKDGIATPLDEGEVVPYQKYEEYANDLAAERPNASEERQAEIDELLPQLEKKQDYLQNIIPQLDKVSAKQMSQYDYTDWDAMTESDKISQIKGWEYLDPKKKEQWNNFHEVNRPLNIYQEEITLENGETFTKHMLGRVDLSDLQQIWIREFDQKAPFFEVLFGPISGEGKDDSYEIKNSTEFDDFGIGSGKITIVHKASSESIVINEIDELEHNLHSNNPEKYGKYVSDFLARTLSEEDKIKLNKNQHYLSDLHTIDDEKYLTVTNEEKGEIKETLRDEKEVHVDIGKHKASGVPYISEIRGGFHTYEQAVGGDAYGSKVFTIPGEHYQSTLQMEESLMEHIGDNSGYATVESLKSVLYGAKSFTYPISDTGLKTNLNKLTTVKFPIFSLLTEEQKKSIINNFEPGKAIKNPNYEALEGGEAQYMTNMIGGLSSAPYYPGESPKDRAESFWLKNAIQEKTDEKTEEYGESLKDDVQKDIESKLGASISLKKSFQEITTNQKIIENITDKNITPIQEELAKIEADFLLGEDVQPLTGEELYKNAGVFLTQEESDEEFQKIVDNNPIIINGEEIIPGQKGFDIGAQKIIDKYTFPTQGEYNNYFDEIQNKINNGKISHEEGSKQWNNYKNELIENENNLKTELENYDNEYQEQADKVATLIEEKQEDQRVRKENADIELETYNKGMEDYVFLANGKKVPKIKFEKYQALQNDLKKEYKVLDKLYKESEGLIAKIEDTETKNYLIQKNYDPWEKFAFTASSMFSDILLSPSYMLLDLTAYATGQLESDWMKNVNRNFNNYKNTQDKLRESYRPDVEFKNAFKSWDNFGRFFVQEVATQGPIFLTIGLGGGLGVGMVSSTSYVESMQEFHRMELENPGVYSEGEKRYFSLIYAGSEAIDLAVNRFAITKSLRVMTAGRPSYIASGLAGIKKHFKRQLMPTAGTVMLEMGSEAATTMVQNWAVGRSRLENVDHAVVSAGMFSVIFQGIPFIKGSVMASFSDSKTKQNFRNNLEDIQLLKLELNKKDLDLETRKAIEDQVTGLNSDNDIMLENELKKFANMSPEFTNTFFTHINKSENLKRQYADIKNNKTLDPGVKKKTLESLEKQFDKNDALLNILKTDPAFGEKFFGFENSTKKEDVARREEIFNQAATELATEGKIEPSEKAIRERARLLYNTQEIQTDYNSKKKNGVLSRNFKSYNTVDEAIEAINEMDLDPKEKEKLRKEIKEGAHGSYVFTKDSKGKKIKNTFQVVENMAKDHRTETKTHEQGHDVLERLFGENPKAFNEISDQIFQYLQNHDIGSYLKLKIRTNGMNTEEVLTNFMEMVADGGISVKGGKNKTLPTILGFSLSNIISRKTKSKTGLGLQGETDAVVFIEQLAKKIKNGTIKLADIKAGKKSEVVKKYEDFKTEQKKGFKLSRASVLGAINNLLPNNIKTKRDYYRFIRNERQAKKINEAILLPGGVVNNYIRDKASSKEEADKVISSMFLGEVSEKTGLPAAGRIFNFDPEAIRKKDAYDLKTGKLIGKKGEKVGAKAFGEFIFAGNLFMKLDAKKSFVKETKRTAPLVSGDVIIGETGKTVFETTETEGDLSPEELLILKQETPAFKRKRQETLDDLLKLDDNLKQEIVNGLKLAFGTKLPEVAVNRKQAKEFEKELLKIITDRVRIKIQKKFGTELAYNEFIKNDLLPLLKFIPDAALRDMERNVGGKIFPDGRKILATQIKLGRKADVIKYQKKGQIPITVDPAKAAATKFNVPVRLPNPTSKELLAFFRGINAEEVLGYQPPGSLESGMLGTRKDKLAELLTREIAKDYAMQVVRDPKVLQKITDIEALQNRIVKDSYVSEVGAILNRDPDAGSINTDNSSVKYSRKSDQILIEQVDLITDLIEEFGFRNVIDKDGNFLLIGPNENISTLAITTALEIHDAAVIEQGEAKKFKDAIFASELFPELVKSGLLTQGNLKYAVDELNQLHVDASVVAPRLGPEIMNLLGYDILGYYNRVMDSARDKDDGTTGPFYNKNQVLVDIVNNTLVKLPKNLRLEDVRLMNKNKELFGKIIKIQNKPTSKSFTRDDKIKEVAALEQEINNANVANIILAKHIAKTIIELAREGKISRLSAINFLQVQTSAVGGFRGLTRLDFTEILDGSQALYKYKNKNNEWKYTNNATRKVDGKKVNNEINREHPDYKEAMVYYKEGEGKGKVKAKGGLTFEQVLVKEKLTPRGEHMVPNANTMFEIAELIFKSDVNIDTELDLIFSNHTQFLTTVYKTDIMDAGPGGKTSTAGITRINNLDPNDINNIIGPDGRNYQQIKGDLAISKFGKKRIRDASIKHSKSIAIYKAKDNLIKLSKKPKTQGASIFDFDDTLARTKSGVRYTMPNSAGKSAPGRKVIFLAGSAGSGKSNVVRQLGLEKQGFKIVNQDISLEWLSKNSGLPANMRDFTPEQSSKWGELQWEARDIAQRKQMKFQGKGDGIIVDGTGASEISMGTQVMKFRNAGYDVQMIFVESSLETALARNAARKERSLKDFIVERNHKAVMANKKVFKEDFGDNFAEVNTDKLKQGDPMPKSLVNKVDKFTNGYIKGRLTAEEFASKGNLLLEQGAKFDFSEFNKVIDGMPGPLLKKARNRASKYGTKDMFVLTARPQASAFAIQQFLKEQGLNIPIKNITGLANSTGDAKAQWVLGKFVEGYNDIYFVDDAIQNVEAVKQVLDQLDVKSNVVQAKIKFSKNASTEFNTIIEESQGTKAGKIISQAEAKKIGRHKGWWRIFVPASAEDFKGLMYRFLGKGRQGDRHMAWFKDHLFDPFAKGIRSWNNYKQGMVNEYKALKKEFKDINKSLSKKVKGTNFTAEQAVRVYLWDKAGFEIPGLNNDTKAKLIDHVLGNTRLQKFADVLSQITRTKEGYIKPRQGWSIGVIANDLNDIVNKVGRKQFLQDWIENKNAIFTPDNMNKIEALYGTGFRKALENILDRMEHGGNRRVSPDKNVNRLLDWINGSVGAIMFFNMRSALLQTISAVNFTNMSDNNIFKAGAAFANQKQFWTDFTMLFNSPQLKQRRAGIQIDVSASELTKAFSTRGFTPAAAISWLLEKGFTPTQIADSFAIAFGGASFYRNRYNKYIKEGMSPKQANEQAMLDFQEIAEETQQSSREDLISQQQASVLGRIVLAFQNVTMQMTRKTKKHLSDLSNRRSIPGYTQSQSDMANVSGIMYYGVVQSVIFLSLQSALAAYIWGDDEEEIDKKTGKVINGSLDSFLSGMGLHGIIAKTIKNTIAVYKEEKEKGWNREDGKILLEIMSFSPPIGSKLRKIWNAIKTEDYNKGVSEELGWRIENPDLYFWASIIEATTNIPTQRLLKKANNLEEAITGNHMMWQRIMLGLGWSGWTIGVKDEELEAAKESAKEKRAEQQKIEKEQKKIEEKEDEEEEKKKKGIKTVRCSGVSSSGQRCGNTTETADKTWKCYHHMEFTDGMDRDGDGIKEYRCTATKTDGNRCKNKTENTSKKCYAHQ